MTFAGQPDPNSKISCFNPNTFSPVTDPAHFNTSNS